MPLVRTMISFAGCAVLSVGLAPRSAQAGPLIDWLFGGRRAPPAYPVGQPVPLGTTHASGYGPYGAMGVAPQAGYAAQGGYAANYGTYYGAQMPVISPYGAGYPAQAPSGIVAATQPSTMSFVPNFSSSLNRAPVTYYRPLLTTDPNTGAQVVAMAPCTSYEYQTQRVPAVGRSALLGGYPPPVIAPAPSALPTYTLPSGGIPLAYSAPSVVNPTVRSYGTYGTLQPGYAAPPIGQSPYAGQVYGGACGGYSGAAQSQVPGLSAPPGPASSVPYGTAPPATAPYNNYSPSTYPPTSNDPADLRPTLRPALPPTSYLPPSAPATSELRPTLRSIHQEPRNDTSSTASQQNSAPSDTQRQVPNMSPIPAPDAFDAERQWTPPLLREGDMTAGLRPIEQQALELAGQSKRIHWASFEQTQTSRSQATAAAGTGNAGLRPIVAPPHDVARTPLPTIENRTRSQPSDRYDTGGWKAVR